MRVQAEIKKWGNSLGVRVAGAMKDIPAFKEGTKVDVEITEKGLVITKAEEIEKTKLPFTEDQLFMSLTPSKAHADLTTELLEEEWPE